jgi:hypothetical protein
VGMDECRGMHSCDDAARGIVNDTFQLQFSVRQHFRGYVNWLDPEEAGHGARLCRHSARLEQFHSQSF